MDDKQFDAIMKKYVASTNNSAEKDFAKLNKKEPKNSHHISFKFKLAIISCMLVIAISLSIFLPLYLRDDGVSEEPPKELAPNLEEPPKELPPIQYYDDSEFDFVSVDSISEINDVYDFDILQPTIQPTEENMEEAVSLIKDKDQETIFGVCVELPIYDDFTGFIYMYTMWNGYSLKILSGYDANENRTTWSAYDVDYYIEFLEEYSYVYRMKFGNDKYTYYLEVERYDEIEISELLSLIFE